MPEPIRSSRVGLRWLAVIVVLATSIGCDQATKRIARYHLKDQASHSYCGDVLRLEYAENPGAFLGLGGSLPAAARWVAITCVNVLISVAVAAVILINNRLTGMSLLACTLLLGGAIGNLIDRLKFDGQVIDFLNVGVGPLRTGIFNLADVAIMGGAVLLTWGVRRPTARQAGILVIR